MALTELLSGIMRFFPNTMIVTLLIVGAVTGKLPWILIAVGGLLLAAGILTLQYIFGKALGLGGMPGAEVLEACSLVPMITGPDVVYSAVPSLWMAVSTFFLTYIFVNAMRVYSANPVNKSKEALPVQQRKGIGMISMLATTVLFIFLLVPRYRTSCETMLGTALGVGAGVAAGWIWWHVLNACGSDVFPDIHGVMMGLKPGMLHTAPVACTPV